VTVIVGMQPVVSSTRSIQIATLLTENGTATSKDGHMSRGVERKKGT